MKSIKKTMYEYFEQFPAIRRTKKRPFRNSRDKGAQYLLEKQHQDGSMGNCQRGIKEYFKVLLALDVGGYTTEALRLCEWIRSLGMTSEGDFGPRPQGKREHDYYYHNAWIICGAHRLGEFDISQKGMDFLTSFRDPESGGFYSSPTEREASTKQDLVYVGFAGLAALYTGRMDIARGVGSWMKSLMMAQPRFPQELYTVYSRDIGLHIQFPLEEEKRHRVSGEAQSGDQFFFQIGVAGGFLARLYQATGEADWLQLAKQYMEFAEKAHDHLYTSVLRAGKVGWAASILYSLTGERQYQDMAIRIGHLLVSSQSKLGSWCAGPGKSASNDITAEMVVWLDAIDHVARQS